MISRKRNRPEDGIQRAVFSHITTRGIKNLVAFAIPNGGKRSKIEATIMKGLGVTAGMPDICLIHDERPYFLELKAERGRLSDSQKDMIDNLLRAGAKVEVATTIDHAIHTLELWGLLKGRAAINMRLPEGQQLESGRVDLGGA